MLLLTLTLTLLGVLALGFWIFAAAPGRPENRAFAAFMWLAAVWVVNDLRFWCFHGPDTDGMAWARGAFLVSLLLQLSFVHFTWIFPTPRPVPRLPAALLTLATGALAGVVMWGEPIGAVGFRDGAFHVSLTPWSFVLGGFVYLLFLVGCVIVWRKRQRADDPQIRQQLTMVLLSPALTGGLTSIAVVALPLLGHHGLLQYASLAILVSAVLHSYSLLNLRFLRPQTPLDSVRLFPVTAKLSLAVVAFWLATVVVLMVTVRNIVGPDPTPLGWQQAWVVGLVAASLPAMGLILMAQRIVTRPLRQISEVAVQVAAGRTDLRVRLPRAEGTDDEVSVLASTFNSMLERLEQDLQAQREIAESLLRTERLAVAGSLAAGVAHEVNNPLAAISSLVQTAQGQVEDEKTRALLGDALSHMERISGALRDLMQLARPPAQVRRRVDLNDVVRSTLQLLRYDKRFKRLVVSEDLEAGLAPVEADSDQLQQVVLNLLLNARDAVEGQEDGARRVTVATRGGPEMVQAWVSDTGPGVPADDRERLFEPFFTTKPPGDGTGLGLAVCRDLIQRHDGRIEVHPGESGVGTRVVITLPHAPEEGQ